MAFINRAYLKIKNNKYRSTLTDVFFANIEKHKIECDFVFDNDRKVIMFISKHGDEEFAIAFKEREIGSSMIDIIYSFETLYKINAEELEKIVLPEIPEGLKKLFIETVNRCPDCKEDKTWLEVAEDFKNEKFIGKDTMRACHCGASWTPRQPTRNNIFAFVNKRHD